MARLPTCWAISWGPHWKIYPTHLTLHFQFGMSEIINISFIERAWNNRIWTNSLLFYIENRFALSYEINTETLHVLTIPQHQALIITLAIIRISKTAQQLKHSQLRNDYPRSYIVERTNSYNCTLPSSNLCLNMSTHWKEKKCIF